MQNQTTQNLSARWTYPERESLVPQVDKRCFGDVTGWAKSTTHFRRPDDVEVKREFRAIRSLRAVIPFAPRNIQHKEVVIAPHVTKFDPEAHQMKIIAETLAFAKRFETFTSGRVIKRSRQSKKAFLAEQSRQEEIKAEALAPVSQEEVKARYAGITVPRD